MTDWRRHYAGLPGFRIEASEMASARCPFHEDRKASLRLNLITGFADCFAGCGTWNPVEFAKRTGLPVPESNGNGRTQRPAPWPEYIYRLADGTPVFRVLRTPDKQFPQSHWDGSRWQKGLTRTDGTKVERLLYRVPELTAAPLDEPVFLTEGEKDVHTLAERLGLTGTTFAGGAGKAGLTPAAALQVLQGRKVYVLPDNDEPGRKHAQQVLAMLRKAGIEASVLAPFPNAKDVSDWVAAGGTRAQLLDLATAPQAAEAQPAQQPKQEERRIGAVTRRLSTVTPRAVRYLWDGRLPLGKISVVAGRPGLGKSLLAQELAAAVSLGRPVVPGEAPCPRGGVILLAGEDGLEDTVVPRLLAAGADTERIVAIEAVNAPTGERIFALSEDLTELEAVIDTELDGDCRLVIIDPPTSFLGRPGQVDSHRDSDVRAVLGPLALLAERRDLAVLLVAHHRKSAGASADQAVSGSLAFGAAARAIWHVAPGPVDRMVRLLLPGKCNLGPQAVGLKFRIDSHGSAPRIGWLGSVDAHADDYMSEGAAGPGRPPKESAFAEEWLRDRLSSGPVLAKVVEDEAARAGINDRTLRRVKQAIGVKSCRPGTTGPWYWTTDFGNVAAYDNHGHLSPENPHGQNSQAYDYVDGQNGSRNPDFIVEGQKSVLGPLPHLDAPFTLDMLPEVPL